MTGHVVGLVLLASGNGAVRCERNAPNMIYTTGIASRLRLVYRTGYLLEEEAGIPSAPCLHRDLRANGRCYRPIRFLVQPQPVLSRPGPSDRARHDAELGGRWTSPQGVSLCAASLDPCAEPCDLRVASRSGVVEGDHPGDPGIVTAARNPLSSTCPMTARESGVAN